MIGYSNPIGFIKSDRGFRGRACSTCVRVCNLLIQRAWLDLKLARGERIIGRKIGLTSRAMQELLGVDQTDYGFLLNSMSVPSGSVLSRAVFTTIGHISIRFA
jgi:hypothetical protein